MTTIHYALNDPDREMDPSTGRARSECTQTARRAIDIARRLCSGIDEDISEDPIVTTDRFIIDLHFEGRCRCSEPICYGWTKDFEHPHHWVVRGSCKTVSDGDPIGAHLLVSHIVHAWHLAGLIDTITDERGYMLHGDLHSFLGVATADAIPEEVDAVVKRLQAAVVDTVG